MAADSRYTAHYERLASSYDSNWVASSSFVEWMAESIRTVLGVRDGDVVLDVGGGTGMYAERILAGSPKPSLVLVLDPSSAMLSQVPIRKDLAAFEGDASAAPACLRSVNRTYANAIFVKEAVHHFDDPSRDLGTLASCLALDGRLLVVLLPPTIEYPLFSAALRAFERHQPHFEYIANCMRSAGLTVRVESRSFQVSIPTSIYLTMVSNRYMSLLSDFSDEELAAGIQEMRTQLRGIDPVTFPDTFCFVVGSSRG